MAATPTTYAVLGMLATRTWTGYELTQQVRRSLRYVWPTSEGHLYREQRQLVELGWVTVTEEPAGKRTRKRYAITGSGRRALRQWLASEPATPNLQVEGILRAFYADSGRAEDLGAAMQTTAAAARSMLDEMLDEMLEIVDEYLEDGGPLTLLEAGVGGPGDRREFRGRLMYPERLHAVATAIDGTTRLLEELDRFFTVTAAEVKSWPTPTDPALTAATRTRLQSIRDRNA